MGLRKVISGGQTGVDRAALDASLDHGFPCGGFCPRDRRAEDGTIASRYPLLETESSAYEVRTRLNVEHSDGTLIITSGSPTGGTAYTIEMARFLQRPCLVIDVDRERQQHDAFSDAVLKKITRWLTRERIETLNVAGPRKSKNHGIYHCSYDIVSSIILTFSD